jgi:hypothetical protein
VSHGAFWVFLFYLFELLASFLVPERVQEGDAALEWFLHRRRAGGREGDRSQLLAAIMVMVTGFFIGENGYGAQKADYQQASGGFHGDPQFWARTEDEMRPTEAEILSWAHLPCNRG